MRSLGSVGDSPPQLPVPSTNTARGPLPFPATVTTRMGAKQAYLDACLSFPSQKDLRQGWKKEEYQDNTAYLEGDILQI